MQIDCYIPQLLPEVSEYVLRIMESSIAFKARIFLEERDNYKFQYQGHSFEIPAYFINAEKDRFLQIRDKLEYTFREKKYFSKSFVGICPESNKFGIDIIGTIFVLLSRYEEQVLAEQNFDRFNRLVPDNAINKDYLEIPIVDELIWLFETLISNHFEVKLRPFRHAFNILPTHDVDRPFEYYYYTRTHLMKRVAGDIVARNSLKKAKKRIKHYLQAKSGNLSGDPYNTFDWIMDQSETHNRVSTFHFITESTDQQFDQEYSLTDLEIRNLLKQIYKRNHHIGLHPSFKSSRIKGQVKKELDKLKKFCKDIEISQDIIKSRYHYLKWSKDSISELEYAAVSIDQTLGFAQKPGFRCGTCRPYNAFNFKRMSISPVKIEPLILMEQSLFNEAYMGLRENMEDAWNVVNNLKAQCIKHSGNFTVLWHNSQLVDPMMKEFYLNCIK